MLHNCKLFLLPQRYEIESNSQLIGNFGVKDNVIPPAMKMYLKNNTFIFSCFKTHQQLERVSRLLHDDDGHVKPFNRFLRDVQSIDKKYNRTYLQAEYNFAVASAQSAGKWHEFSEYADRYYLQYRTAKDERVREEHAILDGITLPFDDKFWDEFFPPNGWNCRCEAIQVSKKRYEPSNPSEALARGRAATYKPNADGVNKAAIFRFNLGKEQLIFPKKHPYFPKGCGDCGLNQYAIGKNKPQCTACKTINAINPKLNIWDSWVFNKTKRGVFKSSNLRTGKMIIDDDSITSYLFHAPTFESKIVLEDIVNNINNLKRTNSFTPLKKKGKTKSNYCRKKRRGVKGYAIYYYTYNGETYGIGMEIRKNSETPYIYIFKK